MYVPAFLIVLSYKYISKGSETALKQVLKFGLLDTVLLWGKGTILQAVKQIKESYYFGLPWWHSG